MDVAGTPDRRAHRVLDDERGTPASDVTDHLDRERGFGVALAFDIVSAAVVHLGC